MKTTIDTSVLKWAVLGSAIFLSACATTEPTGTVQNSEKSTAVTASADPALSKTDTGQADMATTDMAKIIVVRDFMLPLAIKGNVHVNGQKVGKLKNGQYLETHVPPGDHILSVSYSRLSLMRTVKQNISVAAGEIYAWELESSVGLAMAGVNVTRLTPFDHEKNPYKISDQSKVKTAKYKIK